MRANHIPITDANNIHLRVQWSPDMHLNRPLSAHSDVDLAVSAKSVREDEVALELAGREKIREAIKINNSEIKALSASLSRIQAILDQRRERAEYLEKIERLLIEAEKASLPQEPSPPGLARRKRERRTSLAWIVRREALSIFERLQRPLDRKELFYELRAAGVQFRSDDETDILQAITKIMWGSPEFVSTEHGYWIASEPPPKV